MELLGDRVRLRSVKSSDLKDLHAWWNDPEFAGPFNDDYPKSREEVSQIVKSSHTFIIEGIADGRKIGIISYYLTRSDYPYLYEIGYRIEPKERNKGYTTEAAGVLIDHMFATLDIERIEAVADTKNFASQRVLGKNGFRREGRLKKRVRLNGKYRDEYIFGLLREEWRAAKGKR